MRLSVSMVCGALVGLNVFLALATVAVIAANGTDNPGITRAKDQPAAGGASAPGPAPAPLKDGSFDGLDLNGDGRVSLAEVAGHTDIVTRFDRADRNRDGKLTQTEFDRLAKLPPPKPAAKTRPPREQIRRDAASAAAGG